jgi:predicted ATPase
MKLHAQNFLGLERVAWEPGGVCLVVGPNGSGKTSLLQAFAFLWRAFTQSVPRAVEYLGGARGLKRRGAATDAQVVLGVEVEGLRWELTLSVQSGAVAEFPGEQVLSGDQVVLRRVPFSSEWSFGAERITDRLEDEPRTCLRAAWDRDHDPRLEPLVHALGGLRIYDQKWSVPRTWDSAPSVTRAGSLGVTGGNLFGVLHQWRAAPRSFKGQYEWVRETARHAFYDIFDDLDIEVQGDAVAVRFYSPGSDEGLPVRRAADGLIVGLLHLTALAGTPPGGLLALDEMENHLHPHAIRVILGAMRERAEERDLHIVLTTHSPVLMNEFAGATDRFFVTEPGRSETPVRLDELHDPRFLTQFALGDLYERLKFGAPRAAE